VSVLPQLERDLLEAHARLAARRSRVLRGRVARGAGATEPGWTRKGLRALALLVAISVPVALVAIFVLSVHTRPAVRHVPSAPKHTTPTAIGSAHAGRTGIGAPFSAFEAAHPPVTDPSACPAPPTLTNVQTSGGCYGNPITPAYAGAGQCCEFESVSTTGPPANRVDGYTQAFPVNTSITAARRAVLALMPPDTVTTGFFIQHDSTGQRCAMWNVASRTLGRWFSSTRAHDHNGVLGIDLNTTNTQLAFTTQNVTQAVISTTALDHTSIC
jgi:hypothetical protein